jgi:CheY-like chemotaxis protein
MQARSARQQAGVLMSGEPRKHTPPTVAILADVPSNAPALAARVLKPAGIVISEGAPLNPPPDVLILDVTQLRGDPLAALRQARSAGEEAPAIVLAAHFPPSRLRELFHLGVGDVLLKPYRPLDLCKAIYELREARMAQVSSQILARKVQGMRELLRRHSDEIRLLSEIGRAVASLDDLDSVLTRVVEAAAFLTEAEEANIYLAESGSNEVVLRASKQAGERHGTLQRLRITDTLAGHVYTTGQPVLRQPMFGGSTVKVQTGFLVQSLIKVPIKVRDQIVGVLGVYNRLTPRTFSEHHLTLLLALASWAGVALDRATNGRPAALASPAQETATAVPESLLRGLARIRADLDGLARGQRGPLTSAQAEDLTHVQGALRAITELPISALSPEALHGLLDFTTILRDVMRALRPEATTRGLELTAEPDASLPLFPGDPKRARRVVEALASEALRRTRIGTITLKSGRWIENEDLHGREWASVSVISPPRPLPPEVVEALETSSADPKAGQLGPGLSMGEVRMIAESMEGKLSYAQTTESTTLRFTLPIN